MADESGIYAEDIVKNSQGNLGLVLQDAEETSDESDSEDEVLKKGQILICWYPSGVEETVSISKVHLADRSLLPGDVVKHANSTRSKQKGFISDVEVIASVKVLAANQIVTNVDCRDLSPLQDMVPGVHVTMGPWLGVITESQQRVTVRLKNGSRCYLEGEQAEMLYDMSDQRDEDSPFYSVTFYPGQMVAGPVKTFKEAKWLSGVKPIMHSQTQVKGTVEEAIVISCEVNWQVCGACHSSNHGYDTIMMPPDPTVSKDQLPRLKVVNHFRHASIQIGDKAFYTVTARDVEMAANCFNSNVEFSLKVLPLNEASTQHEAGSCLSPLSDSLTEEGEGGAWGAKSAEEQSGAYLEVKNVENGYTADSSLNRREAEPQASKINGASTKKYGQSTTDHESIPEAAITLEGQTEQTKVNGRKEASSKKGPNAYKREPHTPHAPGSDSADADEDSDGNEPAVPKTKGANVQGQKHDPSVATSTVRFPVKRRRKRAKRRRKTTPHIQVNLGDRVCVEITSTSTSVDVIWQDGTKELALLSTDLIPVFHLDEQEFFPGDYVNDKRDPVDASIYGAVLTTNCTLRTCNVKWFTREGSELSTEDDVSVYDIAEHSDFVFNSGDVVVRVTPPESLSLPSQEAEISPIASTPTPCVGQVTIVDGQGAVFIRWVDGTVSHLKPQELYKVDPEEDDHSFTMSNASNNGTDDEWETASDVSTDAEGSPDLIIGYSSPEAGNTTGDEGTGDREDKEDNNKINDILSNRNPAFMMIESVPNGHAFKNTTFQPENLRRFLSCVRKEMALLQSSLPEGILVRGYEDRMDLLRVMVSGPVGTPYEHGVFLFDIRLPADYPSSPPVFHYLSMCSGRLNPNLYEDGKVCVSLLGTWSGKGSEVWTSKSNVLQVLVSIQGLILSNEPYYNEAGYEKQRGTQEGLDNSRLYNEMAILKLLQSMDRMISRPPEGFEKEILQHFIQHAPIMIQKFNYWIEQYEGSTEQNERAAAGATCDSTQSSATAGNGGLKPQSNQEAPETTEGAVGGDCTETNFSTKLPEYPLFPLSKGFCKTLKRSLEKFKEALKKARESHCASKT